MAEVYDNAVTGIDPTITANEIRLAADRTFVATEEGTPEFKRAEDARAAVLMAFANAPVASAAGALVKLREIVKDGDVSGGTAPRRMLETVIDFLDGGSVDVADDSAFWGAMKAAAEAEGRSGNMVPSTPGYDEAFEKTSQLDRLAMLTPVHTVAAAARKFRAVDDVCKVADVGEWLTEVIPVIRTDLDRLAGETGVA